MDPITTAYTVELSIIAGLLILAMTIGVAFMASTAIKETPLHKLLSALMPRLAATAALLIITPALQMIPGIADAFDAAGFVLLAWMWVQFFADEVFPGRTLLRWKSFRTPRAAASPIPFSEIQSHQ